MAPPRKLTFGKRYLEGWQIGLCTVAFAWLAVFLMVPRSVPPEEVPEPRVTPAEIAAARARATEAAASVTEASMSRDVRLLGARLRAYGRAEHGGDERALAEAHRDVREVAADVVRHEPATLLALRAYQAERFVSALLAYLRTGFTSDDLVELGGSAVRNFAENGWLRGEMPDDVDVVFRAMHKRRFGAIVAGGALPVDVVEERALLRFLMERPPVVPDGAGETRDVVVGQFVLKRIDEVAALDPHYPALFARGVVLYRMGRFEASAAAFGAYIQASEDGPWRLRAINHYKAALEVRGAP